MNDVEIIKHNEYNVTYKVTNPSKRLLAMCRLLRIKKSRRRRELLEYAKTNNIFKEL